jgi:eukaryotic-like serine/threonine-protein kinase
LALIRGTRLGPYEIIAPLGAGGMGEVFRARDMTLNRDVAIKVLPDSFATDAERLARFTREAQTLASLNHPNIAHIHGLEESGGVRALVMELVEGEDLSERIARGAIPLDEALPIARQIAEALEAAHEQGIIHRDLKPANIKVRSDGTVKVLDFGLAKAMEPGSGASGATVTMSPFSIHGTQAGMILGTAAYMAPEQAAGKAVDKRSDLWSFGVVLLEMLTGQQVFHGETVSHVLAAVLKDEPDWSALPAQTPASIRTLLRRCLEKDRKRRLPDAASARLEIDDAPLVARGNGNGVSVPLADAGWRRVLPWVVAGAFALVALVAWVPWRSTVPAHVVRTTITTSGATAVTIRGTDRDLALSPDGTHVAYIGNNGTQLLVRALDTLEPVVVASSSLLGGPFFSSDSEWVGFFDNTQLQKVAITGGPAITLARVDGIPRGATWAHDNTIIFAINNRATGLQRISAAGGTPEVLTRLEPDQGEGDHVWPELLPDERGVLFTITARTGRLDAAQVVVRDFSTGMQTVLLRGGSHAQYVSSGHLVYVAAGGLRAIAFDLDRRATGGTTMPVLPRLATTAFGAGDFSVATNGTLVYVDAPGSLGANLRTLVWVDRAGKEEPLGARPGTYLQPRLSSDGRRVALVTTDQANDLWIWDIERRTLTPLTLDPGEDQHPAWTPNDRRIIFSSDRGGRFNLWWQAADGTGSAEQLAPSSTNQFASGITPDDGAVVFFGQSPTMGRDVLQLALDGSRVVKPLLHTSADEREAVVSPDGRWLAYESNEAGSNEIFVRPFPNVEGGHWRVSTAGGTRPLWARSGKELFYLAADGPLLRVSAEAKGGIWKNSRPIETVQRRYYVGPNSGRS